MFRFRTEFLSCFESYLAAHYREPITLDSAAHMYYSRYYFAHRFTEITGQSFLSYVTLFRLERARILLSEGRSVLDAVLECGSGARAPSIGRAKSSTVCRPFS